MFVKGIISLQNHKEEININKAFEVFISEKKALKMAEDTIKTYVQRFNTFMEFCPADTLCEDVTTHTILQFVEFLQKRNPDIKTISVNTYLRHLRAIFYYFMEAGYMNRFKIKMLKCEKELKETYSEAELERLLKKPDIKKCNFSEYRNWVMICYLLGTGNCQYR